ncbi:MAG: PadR family transcriptional regulator [Chloroflexia bacterium]
MPRYAERLLPAAYALLGLLADGPAHGYELHRAFAPAGPLADVYRLEINQLYSLLKKLAEMGLVEEAGFEPVGSAPPRRYFSITPSGREELDRWLLEPVPHTREVRLEFLVKLYFAIGRGPDQARDLLVAQRKTTFSMICGLKEQLGSVSLPPDDFRRLVLELRLKQSEAVLGWLDGVMLRNHLHVPPPATDEGALLSPKST